MLYSVNECYYRNLILLLIIFLFILAVLALNIPDLDDLITLVGTLASSAVALIFHPLYIY